MKQPSGNYTSFAFLFLPLMKHTVELERLKLGASRHQSSRLRTFIYTQSIP